MPYGSEIANKPFAFCEIYKNLWIAVAVAFILLLLCIVVLLFYLRNITRMKKELNYKNIILEEVYNDLKNSDNEIQQQFNELKKVQKRLDFSEKQYELLFDKMLNGFFVAEPIINEENKLVDLGFIHANPGFEKQLNIGLENIQGKTMGEIFKYENINFEIYESVVFHGESKQFEEYYPKFGRCFIVNAFKINNKRVGVIFDDISKYKNANNKIQTLNEDLECRVMERTMELQNAVNALETFTYTVSHDLKSPIRAIDGYSRIILEDFGDKLQGDSSEMIFNIRNICKDMIEMINKLLQYSTTSRLVVQKSKVNINEMFENIFNEQRAIYENRDIQLIVETALPDIIGDRILIKQVVYNILINAIKFTQNRDKALIQIGSKIKDKEYLFYVKDNGAGFDMEFSSKLFGLFQRLHSKEEFEGSGIGLVTVKNIIQKHGGKVWIDGQVDVGATVYFTIPF